ncbi:MAG: prolipoprotein diacylglyceryl transferase [Gammaproteobacteria bacterium]|jgi:phosphatidylglycerol:prolipoprotein diacylglycerol transferase
MSYPYVGDLVNHIFGVQWYIPIPMFGTFVATALLVSIYVAKKEVTRFEELGILSKARIPSKDQAQQNTVPVHTIISELAVIAAFFGIVGARIFHILEYPGQFLNDPMSMILTQGGFSIYGGLVFGVIAGSVYLKRREVPIIPMLDALAPAMMLGYGVGRIGCQISGDGDWGIPANMALKPGWLPDWLWAQTYDNNVLGVVIQSPGVYPTPLYETVMALLIFGFLWAIRKTPYRAGYMFSMYLLFSGMERLLIEQIRVNSKYHFVGMSFTQAELISTILIVLGLVGILKLTKFGYLPKIGISLVVLGTLSACVML